MFASMPKKPIINKGSDSGLITSMLTDGENLYYEFSGLTNDLWTDSNLPIAFIWKPY